LNKKLLIYNGYRFLYLNVNVDKLGFKFGHFIITRRKAKHKGKKRQTKKIIKKIRIWD
jgi:ribosomal protein S19